MFYESMVHVAKGARLEGPCKTRSHYNRSGSCFVAVPAEHGKFAHALAGTAKQDPAPRPSRKNQPSFGCQCATLELPPPRGAVRESRGSWCVACGRGGPCRTLAETRCSSFGHGRCSGSAASCRIQRHRLILLNSLGYCLLLSSPALGRCCMKCLGARCWTASP